MHKSIKAEKKSTLLSFTAHITICSIVTLNSQYVENTYKLTCKLKAMIA